MAFTYRIESKTITNGKETEYNFTSEPFTDAETMEKGANNSWNQVMSTWRNVDRGEMKLYKNDRPKEYMWIRLTITRPV